MGQVAEQKKEETKRTRRGNGEGSITKRKSDGLWQSSITIGINPKTGDPQRKFFYGKERKDVAKKLNIALVDLANNNLSDSKNLTTGNWLEIWLETYGKINLKPRTYESYESFIRLHIKPDLGKIKLKDLKSRDVQKLYNNKFKNGRTDKKGGLGVRSVERIHTVLNLALNQAVAEKYIPTNPTKGAKLPKKDNNKEARFFTLEEQEKFIAYLNEASRYDFAMLLDLGTGLRRGELLALKWIDVNWEQKTLKIRRSLGRTKDKDDLTKSTLTLDSPKTKKSNRLVPIPEPLFVKLQEYKNTQDKTKKIAGKLWKENGLIFCTDLGKPLEPRNFNRRFDSLTEKAKIVDVSPHCMRHTYATRLLESNVHIKVVQELLGHSSITMTLDLYSHVIDNVKQEAIAQLNQFLIIKEKSPSQETQEEDKEKE
ncbi:MAG: site-specific integrase [Tissierellia bacterium]|nr:site-specific integrase [Tissierellia bacterium]